LFAAHACGATFRRPSEWSSESVRDVAYTSEQADRGQRSYGRPSPSAGRVALGDLLLLIKATMPQDRPGALGADMYADIVSFLLKMNNYPAGQCELDLDPDKSKGVRFSK
jgi:hypothetical protein